MRNALSIVRAARAASSPQGVTLRAAIAALLIGLGLMLGPASARAADCKPPSYCQDRGACMTIAEVTRRANSQYASQGYSVGSVRLRGHAPTETCLWYEVSLRDRSGRSHVVYWNVTGGQVR